MMLNHQKGPKQNWKKNSCSQFQAPVPQTNDQLGANAPTRLLGPPSNWPYDESFALAMRAAAAVRGMTWNDGVISWMCKQFGVWDRSTQLICTFFLRWAIPFRWACWAAASPQPSSGIAAVFRMYGPMDLGGDVRRAAGGTWAHKSEVVLGLRVCSAFFTFILEIEKKRMLGTMDILVQYSSNT